MKREGDGSLEGVTRVADASFCFADSIRRSIADEAAIGYLDVGPTDALDLDARQREYDTFFGTSPLSSVSNSRASSRSASPARPSRPRRSASDTALRVISGNSKARKNKKKAKARRLRLRQSAYGAAPRIGYTPRRATILKHVAPAETTQSAFDVGDFPLASTGFVALPDPRGEVHSLEYLVGELGFEVVKAEPGKTRAILDANGLVIAVVVWPPKEDDDQDWAAVHRSAFDSLQESRERCRFPSKTTNHRHGQFPALNTGISFGGGKQAAGNLCNSPLNARELEHLLSLPSFKRIAGFASGVFATWAPKLYRYFEETFEDVLASNSNLRRNFRHSVWAAAAFNFGPAVVTARHRDCANLPFGWCGVTALGKYDHTAGGHIALWELKLLVELPPGSTILLTSAAISHSNTPIGEGESRASFTQYSSGGLFRWSEYGHQKRGKYIKSLSKKEKENVAARDEARCKFGLSLFSTMDELRNL